MTSQIKDPSIKHMYEVQPLTTADIINLNKIDLGILDQNSIFISSVSSSTSATIKNTITGLTTSSYPIYGISSTTGASSVRLTEKGIEMHKDCDLKIGDFSVKDSLERIEKQLGIIKVNPELEAEWEELKELGERYRELEKNIHEKLNVWTILKKT